MTCIAVRDGVIAADTRVTGGHVSATIKLHRCDGAIVGFAGNLDHSLVFVDWYFDRKQRKPDIANENEWHALVLSKAGVEYWTPSLRAVPVYDKFTAIGSGAQFAMGAMAAGKTAKQAVAIACKLDESCGLPVVTMRLR